MNAAFILKRAKEEYRKRGVHERGYPPAGSVCMLTAFWDGLPPEMTWDDKYLAASNEAMNALSESLPEGFGRHQIPRFNAESSDDQVIDIYDRAILLLEATP